MLTLLIQLCRLRLKSLPLVSITTTLRLSATAAAPLRFRSDGSSEPSPSLLMATASQAQAVKSLNKCTGRRRFVFKTFSQRIKEIEIDVFRSLDPLKSEPSEGSSFFLDCLVQWRELNTAEDFISFYEEMMPLVQTLPQIILQKEPIILKLLCRLQMKGRLSLEPILRLIAALSRDLLEDFVPFLQKIADSLVLLLKSGADREPEIIEQIFTSLSYIMMYLQKYLVRDVVQVLKVTFDLRYYGKEYIQEFMAESISFLVRNAPLEQLKKGIRKIMREAAMNPVTTENSAASTLLFNVIKATSSGLHSRAEQVLRLLMERSILCIDEKLIKGSDSVVHVVSATFQRLCEEMEASELDLMWGCLHEKITDPETSGQYLSRLISLLISTVRVDNVLKVSVYETLLQLLRYLVKNFVIPSRIETPGNDSSEVLDRVLQLMLCVIDGLSSANHMTALSELSWQWAPVFSLRNLSFLTFLKELLLKDPCILHAFRPNIISALADLVETPEEEVIYLLLIFCERLQVHSSSFLDEPSREGLSRICLFLQKSVIYWIGVIQDQFQETNLAQLWGVIRCYSYTVDVQANPSVLMDLVDALDSHLMTDSGKVKKAFSYDKLANNFFFKPMSKLCKLLNVLSVYLCDFCEVLSDNNAGFCKPAWESLIGAGLGSYHKLLLGHKAGGNESAVSKFLYFAKKYISSTHILSSVADYLDSVNGSSINRDGSHQIHHPELEARNSLDALDIFSENLCHPDKLIRLSTLRILCHYESLDHECSTSIQLSEKKLSADNSLTSHVDELNSNVLHLLLSIEATPLSISTSRKVILLITRIQMELSAGRIPETYLPAVVNGVIGLFYNRFNHLWNPAMECLAVLIGHNFGTVWEICVKCLEQCESYILAHQDQSEGANIERSSDYSDLVRCFNVFDAPSCDSTPRATVLSLLIQSLKKVPTVVESRSRQIVLLFLKFLGYNVEDLSSVKSYNSQASNGKAWKSVLKEWLNLLSSLRNPKSLYRSQFLKEVLEYRLLDDNDAEVQLKALESLLNWKDDFLLPYGQHLKNLISAKSLREELTTWSLCRGSDLIDEQHRACLVPIVIRILVPKVRKLKTLATQKSASVHHRKAVIGFLADLDVDELPLFIALLIKPLQNRSQNADNVDNWIWCSSKSAKDLDSSTVLRHFSGDNIKALSLKKRSGFLHVIKEILGVFDESHISPYLDLLMGCVLRILASCTSCLDDAKISFSSLAEKSSDNMPISEKGGGAENRIVTSMSVKQFKDTRSLCLKIISLVLNKYEDHDFGCEFWDLFFYSMKPLIDGFKQEGASSEKPSSLFICFLAMSKSYRLVPQLSRENNLVQDIFSILTVVTASKDIVSFVLKFIENLLNLDCELDSDDSDIKKLLLPNIDALVCSLHCLFTSKIATNRGSVEYLRKRGLNIFKLLSKYIKDPSAGRKIVDILLPLLTKRHQPSDACVKTLQVVQHLIPILGGGSTSQIVATVSPLLISASMDIRLSICDLLDAIAGNDSSLLVVAKLLRELNSTSALEMGGLDYDIIIGAYERINFDFFYSVQEQHALIVLSHCVHDMSSQELILRHSAYRLLHLFVEFSEKILNQEVNTITGCWSGACIQSMIKKFLIKHMGYAMNGEASVQKVWVDLLREMVLKLQKVPYLESYKVLIKKDQEQDFFKNIVHLQKHRRAKALSQFSTDVGSLSLVITTKVFMPLFFNMLLDVQDGKGEHLRNAYVEALASISGRLEWKPYYGLLTRCFREMKLKSDKQKLFLRLISSVLDHFPFSDHRSSDETKVSAEDTSSRGTSDITSCMVVDNCTTAKLFEKQTRLQEKILPMIQKLLNGNTDNVNANVCLVALKVLKLLPHDILERDLPNIIHRISNFLKNRLESVRDEARLALAGCLKVLGLDYLQFIVKILRATLKRGYELHVLGYTLNFLLSKCLLNPMYGSLDYCLEELLSVAENDILGDVSEEKEVEKIASKMKETRKQKSFETLKLIAQSVTFRTHALRLLSPVTRHLQSQLTQKLKLKLETMLNHIASGIECNPSAIHTDLLIFTYGLLKDGIQGVTKSDKSCTDDESIEATTSGRLISAGSSPQCSHLITVFALGILCSRMKSLKLHEKEEQLLSMLDPFVRLLGNCLSSKYEDIVSAALRCLSILVRLPLPSIESEADNIKTSLLVIAQGSMNASSPLMQSCLRLLTVLLRSTGISLSSDQLHILIQFPVFVDLERNPSFVALSLLKAIVNRKLVVHEIYDIVKRVGELMVTSQVEAVRKKCSQILLQFLLDYHLSKDRLQEHLDFLLGNLRYEHPNGREAVLEMLHAIVIKFPKGVVDQQSDTFFVHLVICLANDHDNKVRSMTGAAIKLLIGRVSPHSLHSIIESSLSWYLGEKQYLWSAAAQVLGLLVEVTKKGFQMHIDSVLAVIRGILQSAINVLKNTKVDLSNEATVPLWKEAYYSMVLLEKILLEFPELRLGRDLEDIWEIICELLLHPHVWLRNISNRLVALYFTTVTKRCKDNREKSLGAFYLMRPSRLLLIAVSLCHQLKAPLTDDAANSNLRKDIVFAIENLHSVLGQECTNSHLYWSALERHEEACFLKAFQVLDPKKGRGIFASLTSGFNGKNGCESMEHHRYFLVSYLLKWLGKIALQMEAIQMKIVFDSFKLLIKEKKILEQHKVPKPVGEDEGQDYAYQMLFPLYKVCEGFAGRIIPDDVKQLAEEVRDSIRDTIGLQVYSEIRKNLKAKRDKRRQKVKLMAVINPERNAKRKLRIAAKHRVNKKRKIMTMKFGRWSQ